MTKEICILKLILFYKQDSQMQNQTKRNQNKMTVLVETMDLTTVPQKVTLFVVPC